MVQDWFRCSSGLVQVWISPSRSPRPWFRNGSGVVQVWFRNGSALVVVLDRGSGMVQEWFRRSAGLAPGHLRMERGTVRQIEKAEENVYLGHAERYFRAGARAQKPSLDSI